MNSSHFKDLVSRMYLADAVVASWFLTEEVAGIFTDITNIFLLNFLNSVKIFRENSSRIITFESNILVIYSCFKSSIK